MKEKVACTVGAITDERVARSGGIWAGPPCEWGAAKQAGTTKGRRLASPPLRNIQCTNWRYGSGASAVPYFALIAAISPFATRVWPASVGCTPSNENAVPNGAVGLA